MHIVIYYLLYMYYILIFVCVCTNALINWYMPTETNRDCAKTHFTAGKEQLDNTETSI